MNFRIQADELPATVLEAIGFVANHGVLPVAEVKHDPAEGIVSFPFDRLPITGKSLFAGARHGRTPIRCTVTFRSVMDCRIEDQIGGMVTVELLFGFRVEGNEIYFCSAAEDRGIPCYQMTCRVSAIDIQITDDDAEPIGRGRPSGERKN